MAICFDKNLAVLPLMGFRRATGTDPEQNTGIEKRRQKYGGTLYEIVIA